MISGIVNVALAMTRAGSVQTFRKALRLLFEARLRVYKDRLPPVETGSMRKACLDLFLGSDHGPAGAQRLVGIASLLNGDWNKTRIEHYCVGQCCGGKPSIDVFKTALVDALIPNSCPVFPRHRWTQSNFAVDWVGVLISAHSMLQAILPPVMREFSASSRPVTIADFALDEGGEAVDSDLGQAGIGVIEQPAREDQDSEAIVPFTGGAQPLTDGVWAEFNRKARLGATDFAFAPALPMHIVVLRQCLTPQVHLMNKMLQLAGRDWGRMVRDNSVVRFSRLMECVSERITEDFVQCRACSFVRRGRHILGKCPDPTPEH
jgi:hypothetical protein